MFMSFWNKLFRRSSTREQNVVPRLSTEEEITSMAVKRARKMRTASRNLEPAFTALDMSVPLELDSEENSWRAMALAETGLSQNDYPEEVWQQIVDVIGVSNGLNKAAKARLENGDFPGALRTWVKWIYTSNPGLGGRTIDYVDKEDWLLLARIYIGLGCSSGAQRALAWAKTAGEVEERRKDIPRQFWNNMKARWEREYEEVRKKQPV